jgi:hydrogenase expression/formation protein HypD
MLRVPGRSGSLDTARANGASVEVVTSALGALRMAREKPERDFVFIAVGFETTIPGIARTVELAAEMNVENLFFLLSLRTVPNALEVLCSDSDLKISGFILPGHVSTITGLQAYRALEKYAIPGVITGFSPLDILGGLHKLLFMLHQKTPGIENMYKRFVRPEGNLSALKLINKVFEPEDAVWRGVGTIPSSGLAFRKEYRRFDIREKVTIPQKDISMPQGCSCGEVLKGKIQPDQCQLFGKKCTPDKPIGPCMVSSEGSCAAYYRYERNR